MSELLPEILTPVTGQQPERAVVNTGTLEKPTNNQEFANLLTGSLEHFQVPSGESGQLVSELLQGKNLPVSGSTLPSIPLPLQAEAEAVLPGKLLKGLSGELPQKVTEPELPEAGLVTTPVVGLVTVPNDIKAEQALIIIDNKATGIETTSLQSASDQKAIDQDHSKKIKAHSFLPRSGVPVNPVAQPAVSNVSPSVEHAIVAENGAHAAGQNTTVQGLVRQTLGSQVSDAPKDSLEEGRIPALVRSDSTVLQQKAAPQVTAGKIVLTGNAEPVLPNNELLPTINPVGNSELGPQVSDKNNGQFNLQLTTRFDTAQIVPISTMATGAEKPVAESLTRAAPELQMQSPFNKPEWGNELGTKIVMMTRQEMPSAHIRMNPAHLGPIEVRISMQNDVASVSFVAANPAVRDAIEGTMPRLREMLENQGLGLDDVNVSDHAGTGNREQAWEHATENQKINSENTKDLSYEDDMLIDSGIAKTYQISGSVDYFV